MYTRVMSSPVPGVYRGIDLYNNNAFRSGSEVVLVNVEENRLDDGVLFRKNNTVPGQGECPYYFIPNANPDPQRYMPNFEKARRVEDFSFATDFASGKQYLQVATAMNNIISGEKAAELPEGSVVYLIDLEKCEPIEGEIATIAGTMDKNAKCFVPRELVSGTESSEPQYARRWHEMQPIANLRFTSKADHAQQYINLLKTGVLQHFGANVTVNRAPNPQRQIPENNPNTPTPDVSHDEPNTTKEKTLSLQTAANFIANYLVQKYNCGPATMALEISITPKGDWFCTLHGSGNATRTTIAAYQDHNMSMTPYVLGQRVLCRELCQKILSEIMNISIIGSAVNMPTIGPGCENTYTVTLRLA